jgi:hypothetical protein
VEGAIYRSFSGSNGFIHMLGSAPLLLVSPKQRERMRERAMYLSDLIIENQTSHDAASLDEAERLVLATNHLVIVFQSSGSSISSGELMGYISSTWSCS